MNNHTSLLDAIRATGMEPPPYLEPGRFYRYSALDKGRSNRSAWCLLFKNGQGGCFGDWSTGLMEIWHPQREHALSHAERAALKTKIERAKQCMQQETRQRHQHAADRAQGIWCHCRPAPADYLYLLTKQIQSHGAGFYKGTLALPVLDFNGQLTSMQFITMTGEKLLLSGGRKQGCYIPIPCSQNAQFTHNLTGWLSFADYAQSAQRIIICEGWATGCTLSESEPDAFVVVAIDAGNLMAVAMQARACLPDAEIIIAGDDDRQTVGNPGATKACAAAVAARALLALPEWPESSPDHLTDFNDLAVWQAGGMRHE
jgi:putative DNA primase/helicase